MAVDPAKKDRFVNRSGGWLGVLVRAPGTATGFKGISLYPGQEIDLDEEEQAMSANAPRDPRANPLANGQLHLIAEQMDFRGRRPLRPDAQIATADPTRPETWSAEQREHVESEAEKLAAEREAVAGALAAQAETGNDIDPAKQPAVGEYQLFEEPGEQTIEQPPVVGGATVQGEVATPDGGEPHAIKQPDSLEPTEDFAVDPFAAASDVQQPATPAAVSEIRGPAERLMPPQPSQPEVSEGSLQGTDAPGKPRPRVTATP